MKYNLILNGIFLSILGFACENGEEGRSKETKLTIASEAQCPSKLYLKGVQLTWSAGDAFSVYDDVTPPERGNFYFSLTSAPGTSKGSFAGVVSFMPQRKNLYAFYPYQARAPHALTEHPVRVPQVQEYMALEDSTSIGRHFRMAAKATYTEGDPSVAMRFKVLTAVWEFHLLNRSSLTQNVRSLEVRLLSYASGKGFLLETTYHLPEERFGHLATDRYSDWIRIDQLEAVQTGAPYRLVTLPSRMTQAKLQFRLSLDDGKVYVFNRIPMDLDLQGGLYYSTLLDVSAPDAVWGEEIYSENMGDVPVQSATALAGFSAWKKAGTGASLVQYAGNADVRSTLSSPEAAPYSGGNNIFFGTLPRNFLIHNLNVAGKEQLTLEWSMLHYGYFLFSSDMLVDISLNQGLSWHSVRYENPEINGWQRCKTSFCIPANSTWMQIRFRANEASVLRLDDVRLTSGGDGPLLDPENPNDLKYLPGDAILMQEMGEGVAAPMSTFMYPSGLSIAAVTLTGTLGPGYLSATKWLNNTERFWYIRVPLVKHLTDSVKVSYALYSSGTGPRDFAVLAGVDLNGWFPVRGAVPQIVATNATTKQVSFTFVIPEEDKAIPGSALFFRIYPSSAVSANGGVLSQTGTSRIAGTFSVIKL